MTGMGELLGAALLLASADVQVVDRIQDVVVQESRAASLDGWFEISGKDLVAFADDDLQRHAGEPDYLAGIDVEETFVRENGFIWHLLRYTSRTNPAGPLWMVPHDDENAAFEAAIQALKAYGGVVIAVNSGPGSMRRQSGLGTCGIKAGQVTSCDPNRNFAQTSPKFVDAFLRSRPAEQPIVALHTNSSGFSGDGQGGRGDITILDASAFQQGKIQPREDGHFATNPSGEMANFDTLALMAYLDKNERPGARATECQKAMTGNGVHFWHEKVKRSDGSMSNYLALHLPDIPYLNVESRSEIDLAVAAARHQTMVRVYLAGCAKSGD